MEDREREGVRGGEKERERERGNKRERWGSEKTSQTSNRGSWNHKTVSGCVVNQYDFVA
jgi:hypothetical protein